VRFLKPLALAAYALLFAELFLRIFAPQAIMPRYVTGTPWGVRGNIPNATYWHQTPEVTVQYRINSQGMRADRDYSVAKPEGTCRVAVYGDSFFVGYELPYSQTYAVRLEQELQAAGIHAEVLNFSVSGFGQAEMLRAHERFGRKFDPDVVLFEWHSTDPDDNVRSGLYRLEHGTVTPTNATYLPSIAVQDRLDTTSSCQPRCCCMRSSKCVRTATNSMWCPSRSVVRASATSPMPGSCLPRRAPNWISLTRRTRSCASHDRTSSCITNKAQATSQPWRLRSSLERRLQPCKAPRRFPLAARALSSH
jgi:hypothetical protein